VIASARRRSCLARRPTDHRGAAGQRTLWARARRLMAALGRCMGGLASPRARHRQQVLIRARDRRSASARSSTTTCSGSCLRWDPAALPVRRLTPSRREAAPVLRSRPAQGCCCAPSAAEVQHDVATSADNSDPARTPSWSGHDLLAARTYSKASMPMNRLIVNQCRRYGGHRRG